MKILKLIISFFIILEFSSSVFEVEALPLNYDFDKIKVIYINYMSKKHPRVLVDKKHIYIKQLEPYIIVSQNDCVNSIKKLDNGKYSVVTCFVSGGYELEIDNKDFHIIKENIYK